MQLKYFFLLYKVDIELCVNTLIQNRLFYQTTKNIIQKFITSV